MASTDLNSMSLSELKELQRDVAKAVSTFEDRKRKEALAVLEEQARQMGFSIAELTGVKVARTRASAKAKYANPADRSETWSGRGRKPRWFSDAVASGTAPDSLLV
ncbi:MAG: H-NS histone family protein [Rhodobacteraceae bacterium]|nr:H-NS histone family protein [Paracoccaceae bacterium]